MGHHHRFRPCLLTSQPPTIPPSNKPITPNVPYTTPTVSVARANPPSAVLRSMKGCAIFASCASGKRNSNMNKSAGTSPFLDRKTCNVSLKEVMMFTDCAAGCSSSTLSLLVQQEAAGAVEASLGNIMLCQAASTIIIAAVIPIVMLHAKGME